MFFKFYVVLFTTIIIFLTQIIINLKITEYKYIILKNIFI